MATVPKRVYECASQILQKDEIAPVCQLVFGLGIGSADQLLAMTANTRVTFAQELRARALAARVPLQDLALDGACQNLFRIRHRISVGADVERALCAPPC